MNDDDVLYHGSNLGKQWYMDGRLGEEFNRYQEPMQPKYNIKKHLLMDNQVVVNSYYSIKPTQHWSTRTIIINHHLEILPTGCL